MYYVRISVGNNLITLVSKRVAKRLKGRHCGMSTSYDDGKHEKRTGAESVRMERAFGNLIKTFLFAQPGVDTLERGFHGNLLP